MPKFYFKPLNLPEREITLEELRAKHEAWNAQYPEEATPWEDAYEGLFSGGWGAPEGDYYAGNLFTSRRTEGRQP